MDDPSSVHMDVAASAKTVLHRNGKGLSRVPFSLQQCVDGHTRVTPAAVTPGRPEFQPYTLFRLG